MEIAGLSKTSTSGQGKAHFADQGVITLGRVEEMMSGLEMS